jgi:hypothetical protein
MFSSTSGFQEVCVKDFATKDLNFAGVSHFWVFFSFPILKLHKRKIKIEKKIKIYK